MKQIILIMAAALCITISSFSQAILNTPPVDGVVDKMERFEKDPVPYAYVRTSDYVWERRIWRTIDFREKINQVMYYPEVPHNNWRNFMTVIMDALREGTLTAYDATSATDEFTTPLSYRELMARTDRTDTIQLQRNYPPYDYYDTVLVEKFNPSHVKTLRIKEDWYFDKQRSMLEVRIIGLCPVVDRFNEDGTYRGPSPMFWINFAEARPVLAKAEVFNRFNGAARMSYDEFFWKRMFSSYITKVDNQYDRSIAEYATGMDAVLESQRIKDELLNFEQNLWEY
ncbi:MAG: gliding motility protein GldN [Bacteroidales bacterium]|jgi:gliding motility associated protien GldN